MLYGYGIQSWTTLTEKSTVSRKSIVIWKMPPPKKPKGSWEEFISKSQADSSADQQEDSFGSHNTDNRPFNRSVGIEKKGLVDCSSSFTRPEALVTPAPVDLSLKPDRKNTLSNSIPVALKETITPSGRAHIQDSNPYAENHPQLRNILLHASSDPILSDIGENLVSSGSQDFHVTRIHSCPSGSLTSSKILWRNPSMQASATKLQPQTAFSTNMPSGGNNRDQGCLLDSSRRERVQNLSCLQIKQENDCFRLDRQDHNPSSGNIVRNTLPLAMVNSNSGYSDSVREKMLTERYSTSPTNGPCDQDRRNGFATQDGTADSTTHLIFNSSQMKRSRFNGERAQVRHQALRGQGSTTKHIEQEPHARGPITNNLICLGRGNLGQERPRNPAPEFNSSESQSLSQKTIARLFDELHRKDSPVTEYLVSLDDELQRPQILSNAAERILAQMQSKPRIPRLLQTSLNGKPQNEDGFGQGKVENGSVIDKKLFPTSARRRLASHRKMTTLRELLCDDSGPIINSSSATPSGEVNGVNIADSCATHRLQETGDLERMEDNRTRSIGGCPESFESENSSELPALVMITDIHSSPEMPSSSSSNERAKNKADAKGVCRCQICDDVASGFHYGVWSCEGCKAFFKRSLHGPVDYVCPATNNCTIDKLRRKSCQACRLRKCHEAGMTAGISRKEKGIRLIGKKRKAAEEELSTSDDPEAAASSSCLGKLTRYDSVGSSHDVDQKPNLASVEEMNPSPPSPPSPALNPLVERLLAIELPPREAEFNDSITEFSALHLLSGLLGLINCQLVDIINWSKALTEFSKSSLESRTRLLVASWSELLILSTVWQSIPQPNVWVCAPNLLLTRAHCKVAMIETLFDQIMSLVQTFRRLQLTETELVLLRLTILLNSGFSVIESQPALANLRNLLDETWQQIPPDASSRSRLSHLLLTLPDIRQCSLMMHNVIDSARHRQGVPTYNLLLEMLDCDVLRMSDMQAADVVMEDLD